MPIIRRRSRKLIAAGLAGAAVMGAVGGGTMMYFVEDMKEKQSMERSKYEQRITELEQSQLLHLNTMKTAWVPLKDIPPGHRIEAKDLKEVRLPADAAPANLASLKDEVEGKGAKIGLLKGTPITRSMLFEEAPTPDDLRHREMKAVYLPSNLIKGDVVDIRVQFPTGQDYIVLSKKKIDKLQTPAFWTTLSEQEILLLSSALVDAYLHQATIYALTYVEPELQAKAIPTYPPNEEVAKLIASDPNIVQRAEKQLETAVRRLLEEDLRERNTEQQVQMSEIHVVPALAGTARSPDSWSPASSGGQTTSDRSTGSFPAGGSEEVNEPRVERDVEAEQILGGYGLETSATTAAEGTQDDELIFSAP